MKLYRIKSVAILVLVGCHRSANLRQPSTSPSTQKISASTGRASTFEYHAESGEQAIRQTLHELDQTQPLYVINNTPFSEALSELKVGGKSLPLDVMWEHFPAGTGKNSPMIVRLRNVKTSRVLRTLLASLSPKLFFGIKNDGRIVVSTREDVFNRLGETRTYDVSAFIPPEPSDVAKQLEGLITITIAPNSWRSPEEPFGGKITFEGSTMTVFQTPDAHVEITGLLQQLFDQRRLNKQPHPATTKP